MLSSLKVILCLPEIKCKIELWDREHLKRVHIYSCKKEKTISAMNAARNFL